MKRLYAADGIEIEDASAIASGDVVFGSGGEPFIAPGSGPKRKASRADVSTPADPAASAAAFTGGRGRRRANTLTGQPAPGDTVGRFRIVRMLGQGGFGSVYLASSLLDDDKHVALKILSKGSFQSAADAERFVTEVTCLTELTHPNIVQCLGVDDEPVRHPCRCRLRRRRRCRRCCCCGCCCKRPRPRRANRLLPACPLPPPARACRT